jgi:alginate O-acetyltransferase complex protein AlgI
MDINSWHFLVLSLFGIIFCRLLGPSILRSSVLLCINGYFIGLLIKDLRSGLYLVCVLVAIYLTGLWKVRRQANWSGMVQLAVVAGIWGILFLTKDPSLFAPANPFFQFPVQVIGLSYLMFRGISYVMEVDLSRNTSPLTYLNYMLFFPMIFAGPIERYNEFQRQSIATVEVGAIEILPAMHRVANGFIKKFILADNLAAFGILSVGDMADASAPLLWLGATAQLFIVYLDFSGYCDIVIGIASLMGFRLRENFDHPFRSPNIQVFWERWHISLGQMIRDYVFNPLAKFALVRTPRNYHLTCFTLTYCFSMLLVALWHGTTIGFLVFGLVHAAALLVFQIHKNATRAGARRSGDQYGWKNGAIARLSALSTYMFVSLSLTLWIVADMGSLNVFKKMFGLL